jgi:hypothetical protein
MNTTDRDTVSAAIFALMTTADVRQKTLGEARAIRAAAAEAQAAEQARAKRIHMDANRALIETIDSARAGGMKYAQICEVVELTYQSLVTIRRSLASNNGATHEEEES